MSHSRRRGGYSVPERQPRHRPADYNFRVTIQPGILSLGASEHVYLEFDLRQGVNLGALACTLRPLLNHPTTHGANIVLGVRPSLWAAIAPAEHVPAAKDFDEPIIGDDGFEMPASQRDLWIWIAGSDRSVVFDASVRAITDLAPFAHVVSETVGWVYHDSRDLTGFEDGTENPPALDAPEVISVPSGVPGAGSSVLLFQLWSHIPRWRDETIPQQEAVIGRTKRDSIEFDDDVQPPTSHVSRTTVRVDGQSQEIFRRNTAYGNATDHGTVFVGFSQDQWRQEAMLRQMAGVDGVRDALTRFTTPETGSWYIVPSLEAMRACLPDEADSK